MSKFGQHIEYFMSFLPEFGGMTGFLFYSFLVYLIVLFFGWLLNPTVDKIIQDDLKAENIRKRGEAARKKNKEASEAAAQKNKSE